MANAKLDVDEGQLRALQLLASARNLPVEEVLRQAIENYLRLNAGENPESVRRKAISAANKFRSGRKDISRKHDDYLAKACR